MEKTIVYRRTFRMLSGSEIISRYIGEWYIYAPYITPLAVTAVPQNIHQMSLLKHLRRCC